ncbi:hypothetical protein H6F61_02925 [Cyanobacteria bacterium FACHB-472]|nr:hypothetical protein [Cyanobacteria bacterium FACHB-472]
MLFRVREGGLCLCRRGFNRPVVCYRIPNTCGIRFDPPACGDSLNKGVLKNLAAFLREVGGDVLGAIAFHNLSKVAIASIKKG